MKKIFTLICAAISAVSAFASTVDDLKLCKHSYVLVCDDVTANGTNRPDVNTLVGDGKFLLQGTDALKSVSFKKGSIDLSDETWTAQLPGYEKYGSHLNSLRLKNGQDMVAVRVTEGSKIIVLGQSHSSRYAYFTADAAQKEVLEGQTGAVNTMIATYTVQKAEELVYIGSKGGDLYISYIIIQANEAPGTPYVTVGEQTYDNGLWYREVTCDPAQYNGSTSIVTYTTDGTAPTAESPIYKEPIKCYKDMTVKFQAYEDVMGDGESLDDSFICTGADNDGDVSFKFDAPTITAEKGAVTITSKYKDAVNVVTYLDKVDEETSNFTLTESATVSAYTKITNGEYAVFTSTPTKKDVYVLDPIKEEKLIYVENQGIVKDSIDTKGDTVYYAESATIAAAGKDFFVKDLEFGVVSSKVDSIKQFQIDEKEVYIKMNNTNISFCVAAGDSVDVEVICSKNACKNIFSTLSATPTKADSTTHYSNLLCMVNVNDKTYGDTIYVGDITDLASYRNVIKFGLAAKDANQIFTFKKYSGTGNILISSIKITPAEATGIKKVAAKKAVTAKKMIQNGQLVVVTSEGTFNIAGVRIK